MNIITIKICSKSLITYALWGLQIIVFAPPTLLLVCLPASWRFDTRLYYWLMSAWCWCIVRSTFISYEVHGRENVPVFPNQPSIIAMNHMSALDIPVVEMVAGNYPHVWISKDYSKVPFLGFVLKRMHVLVSLAGLRKPLATIKATHTLTHKKLRHVFIFPEGRRYDDGAIHDFYAGYAVLAEMLDRPVVPILLTGLHAIYPKNSWYFNTTGNKITVTIGAPIHYKDYASREEFLDKVSNWFKLEQKKLNALSR